GAGVATQAAITLKYAVTRHNRSKRIVAHCGADGAGGPGRRQPVRQRLVCPRLAISDLAARPPHIHLERAVSGPVESDVLETNRLTRIEAPQSVGHVGQQACILDGVSKMAANLAADFGL